MDRRAHLPVLVRRHVGPLELCLPTSCASSRGFKHRFRGGIVLLDKKGYLICIYLCRLFKQHKCHTLRPHFISWLSSPVFMAPPQPKPPRPQLKRQKSGLLTGVFNFVSQEVQNFVANATGTVNDQVFFLAVILDPCLVFC